MRFFSVSSAFIIIYWHHVKSEMADSYFTLSSSVVVKTDNKVKAIVSNRLNRFNNKKTWNDGDRPRRSGLEKDESNFSDSLGQSWTNIWARHGRIWCLKNPHKKKESAYLPTHTQKSWVGFGQTKIPHFQNNKSTINRNAILNQTILKNISKFSFY